MKNLHGFNIFLTLLISVSKITAQDKNDFVWAIGYPPSAPAFFFGGDLIDFNMGEPSISYFLINYDMDNPVCMSDNNGNLQYYTSGCAIVNKEHVIMENGDNLSAGYYHDYYCEHLGYFSFQGMITLPMPGHEGEYVLFHHRQYQYKDSIDLLLTLVDMKANNGLGKVIEKNYFLEYGLLAQSFTAVRHGNGRDWWIVAPENDKSVFHFYLLDPDGLQGPFIQSVPNSWIPGHTNGSMCTFSPDGTKYVRLSGREPSAFTIFDVDRCKGELNNPQTIILPDSVMYAPWACFSANSRFLYLTNEGHRLYQFDMQSANISESRQLIDEYDGYLSIYNLPTSLFSMTIGPDKRIYMSSGNGVNVMHVIHNPDEAGIGCNFRQHDIILPAHISFFLPNTPTYRLYQIPGSPCDTAGVVPPTVAFWRVEYDSTASSLSRKFVDLSYYQPVSIHWFFGDGGESLEASPTHTFPAPGTFNVCQIVCSAVGVCDTLCKEIKIETVGTSTPIATGMVKINVYPNPAIEECWLSYEIEEGPAAFTLFDPMGHQVLSKILEPGAFVERIDVKDLDPGLYFWIIQSNGREISGSKLIIMRK